MSFDFLNKCRKIHFIGIGGISMSGLAEIMLNQGFQVSGSDRNTSKITEKLKKLGAEIFVGHKASNISNVDLVVYTAAISDDNPELISAKQNNLPLMNRAEFLGNVMKGHKYDIAVAGTHGKTTTTSMLSHITLKEDVDPTILVGGQLDIINGNVRAGKSEFFLTEACEYKESFLSFYPYIGIILNIDEDHLDFYKDINHIKNTFKKFIGLIPEDGYLIANFDDEKVKEISTNAKCNILSYGLNEGNITASNINYDDKGCASFDVLRDNSKLFSMKLNVPGEHNVSNALASVAASLVLNFSFESIKEGLFSFFGTHRRFEFKGTINDITIIDDYAHHPTEIKATIDTAKKQLKGDLYAVFQPHTYTRTITLFDDFSKAFHGVDEVILADIYAAREEDTGEVNSTMLSDAINKNGVKSCCLHSFDEIENYLINKIKPNDTVITIGAGDVYKIGETLIDKLKQS